MNAHQSVNIRSLAPLHLAAKALQFYTAEHPRGVEAMASLEVSSPVKRWRSASENDRATREMFAKIRGAVGFSPPAV